MAKTDFETIDQYHKVFPADVQSRMQAVREAIREVVPEAEEVISYQIPCFKYKGYLIYYAAFAKHLTISSPWSASLLKEFAKELKRFTVTKSAIQFLHKDPLPLELIKKIVAYRRAENEKVK
jgi:uncharacterized protein YdhG (YjbR/CyaY superfamily)